ncbi:ABC transporter ATP-binding protein [Polymorphospora rubra]|uniref:Ferric enterobactin transporter FepC n=1 Tax=Polymorphospora rubra TaxID=338584 RepID=A0A810NB28_9ACTN|nr:ABC transporter ATP-binding protein [Polymorphospora rubra]BCJ68545.1 ferric enterobactin transporter FepC [Polymorphospora rubra]
MVTTEAGTAAAAPVPVGVADQARRLEVTGLRIGYDARVVVDDLDLTVPPHSFSVIVGPNACGKSTLLRSLARLLAPQRGTVLLDGTDVRTLGTKELARKVGLLPQSTTAPEAITVVDLVARGRYPHQRLFRAWSAADEAAVRSALEATRLTGLAARPVDELSGGQRQRVWIAMVLAQQTPIVLLDEPTTFLDIAHQIDVLDLCRTLHQQGRTLVAVLHDLNQAARYASHLIAMKDGAVVAQGPPAEVVTAALVEEVFGVRARILTDPETGTPIVVPLATGAVIAES